MDVAHLPNGSLRIHAAPRRAWLVSAIPIAVGLALLAFFALTATLACRRVDRGQIDCTLTRSLLGAQLSRAELRGLTGARVSRSSGTRGATYRVDLAARSGDEALSTAFSSGEGGKAQIVQEIQRFVDDERAPELTVAERGPAVLLLVGLVFLAAGVLASPLVRPAVTWTFDRLAGALIVNERRALRGETTTHPLDQIRTATVWSGQLALRLASGRRLLMASDVDRSRVQQIAQQIRDFLELPVEPENRDPIEAMVHRSVATIFGDRLGRPEPEPRAAAAGESPAAGMAASDVAGARSIPARLLGVALFRAPVYRQIAGDPAATRSAAAIVLLGAAVVGLLEGMTTRSMTVNGRALPPGFTHAIASTSIAALAGLASWRVGGAVAAFAARALFRGRTRTPEMLRALGYASAFRLLWPLPGGFALSWVLSALGTVIAVREAAELDTSRAAVTAVVAWAIAFVLGAAIWFTLTCGAVASLGSSLRTSGW